MTSSEDYWEGVFGTQSKEDLRDTDIKGHTLWDLQLPITAPEVQFTLRKPNNAAPGLDGMTKTDLNKFSPTELACHFNLWLLTGTTPTDFKKGVITLIPKCTESSAPRDFRPITIMPIMCRLFHKILSDRISEGWKLHIRQKAFQSGDGLAANVWLIRSMIQSRKLERKGLCITFIDVEKAFDSVSHDSIVGAAGRMGTPPILLNYIKKTQKGCSVKLKIDGILGNDIPVNRGVKQGDPMSPMLFNAVMDNALSKLPGEIGIEISANTRVNHLAFADDIILTSSSEKGMKMLLQKLTSELKKSGLSINATKCASLRACPDGKNKKWNIIKDPFLKIDDIDIKILTLGATYKYLGVLIGAKDAAFPLGKTLDGHLQNIDRAPLKPAQKLHILRYHLLPKFTHKVILDKIYLVELQIADRTIRKYQKVVLPPP